MSERSWKRRLFRKQFGGVYEWKFWKMPILRVGRWEIELKRVTHQVPREWWVE